MIIPQKGLFSIILKSTSPLLQLRIPFDRRQTSWLFTKRGAFAPNITEDKSIQISVVRVGDLNPGLPYANPSSDH